MKCATEMASDSMIYIPRFIWNDLDIQKLIAGDTQTHTEHSDLFYFFKTWKVG